MIQATSPPIVAYVYVYALPAMESSRLVRRSRPIETHTIATKTKKCDRLARPGTPEGSGVVNQNSSRGAVKEWI